MKRKEGVLTVKHHRTSSNPPEENAEGGEEKAE